MGGCESRSRTLLDVTEFDCLLSVPPPLAAAVLTERYPLRCGCPPRKTVSQLSGSANTVTWGGRRRVAQESRGFKAAPSANGWGAWVREVTGRFVAAGVQGVSTLRASRLRLPPVLRPTDRAASSKLEADMPAQLSTNLVRSTVGSDHRRMRCVWRDGDGE